jgi:serine/threonine-protein kinase
MELPAGTVIDRYRITRLIGIGGMGAIYEVTHLDSGKRVAMKMMSKELATHPEALARFRREVKVTTDLAHPNIVEIVDFGAAPTGEPYLVMEYLDGEDLEARLERDGRVSLPVAVQIIKQVASALSVAHAEGVVHRDLKPGNVFLLRTPDGSVFVKVVDFGISKVLKAATTKLTMARAVVGTPEFMAPEQAAGRIDWIDHRTDQWALAVLAWHMLSGRLPFWKPEVHEILNQVITGDPTPLAPEFAPLIPREVDKVLRRALTKKREDRYPTINAFARAFEAAAATAPARREAPAEAAAPAAAPRDDRARSRPRSPEPRGGGWLLPLLVIALAVAAAGWYFRVEITSSEWWPAGLPRVQGTRPGGDPTIAPQRSGDSEHARRRPPRP